mgnify:CR=1 FL=1
MVERRLHSITIFRVVLARGVGDAFVQIVRVEGPLALYKGLLPVYCRQAPFNMLNYMLMETLLSTFAG